MTTPHSYTQIVLDHYRAQAATHGTAASSTMHDEVTRTKEVGVIVQVVDYLTARGAKPCELVEIGCGNGLLLDLLRDQFPALALAGVEYTPEMVSLAQQRDIPQCRIRQGDVRSLDLCDASCDIVVTERCVINVMDRADQAKAFREIARVLRPGGHWVCVEAFIDGLKVLNEARAELGLEPNNAPHHNLWLDKHVFIRECEPFFDIAEPVSVDRALAPSNFLSTHYFVSRVVYPAITKREVLYNTHFVRFFADMPPSGDYSPIQVYLLRKHVAPSPTT